MLLLIAVLALLSAAYLLTRFARKQIVPLTDRTTDLSEPPFGARPLFQPSDSELKAALMEDEAREKLQSVASENAEQTELVDAAFSEWRGARNATSAARLLTLTAEHGRDTDFARASEEILKVYRESGVSGLSDLEMAALLDSHIRLIPASTRDAGALFWLQQEVTRLRSE